MHARKIRSPLAGPAALLTTLALLLTACQPAPPEAPANHIRAVQTVQPEPAPAAPPVHTVGRLLLREEQTLAFRVGGIVREIPVRSGDDVEAGDILARLDSTEVDAAVAQARAAAEKAERDRARGERLRDEQVITQQQFDDLVTASEVARAQLEAAKFNQRFSVIRAPADGVVLSRLVERNEMVSAGQPVLSVGSDDGGFVVAAALPDHAAVRVGLGDTATIRLDAHPGRAFTGTVQEISRSANPRTGTFDIEIALDRSDARLASGLMARATIMPLAPDAASHPSVPLSALVQGGDQLAQVFVVHNGEAAQARAVPVEVLWLDDHRAVLKEPLPAEVRVVTSGAGFLRDGDAIRVVD